MSLERPDDGSARIGDFDDLDEGSAPEPVATPHVVIHYRERGIPWLLVPPLIALSAAIALAAGYSIHKYLRTQGSTTPSRSDTIAVGPPPSGPGDHIQPPPTNAVDGFGLPVAEPAAGLPPLVVAESPAEMPLGDVASTETNMGIASASDPTMAMTGAEASPPPAPGEAVASIGFDPSTLLPPPTEGAQPAASPMDSAVASTRMPGASDQPTPAPVPMTIEPADPARAVAPQPAGIPEALLPADPRAAVQERRRLEFEQRQLLDAERLQFHVELRAVAQEKGKRAAPAIQALIRAYKPQIPPAALEQSIKLLGEKGIYARVGLPQRINLLRRLGFPEPVLVDVIYDYETGQMYDKGKAGNAGRDTPSRENMYVRAAQILLNNPPPRPTALPRAGVSPSTTATPATTVPSAGPVR